MNEIIKKFADMLNQGYGKEQVQNEIKLFVFETYIGVATIDRIITMCMELYHEAKTLSDKDKDNG